MRTFHLFEMLNNSLGAQVGRPGIAGWILLIGVIGSGLSYAHADSVPQPTNKPLNVILVLLDGVRPDHLSCYGYRRRTTPSIDWIAKEGVMFTNAFAQAPQTFPSLLALLTSKYPPAEWLAWQRSHSETLSGSLPELLKQAGYETAAFMGFDRGNEVFQPLVECRPFRFFDQWFFETKLSEAPQSLFDWLMTVQAHPFFLLLHGFDAHDPHLVSIQYDADRFCAGCRSRTARTTFELLSSIPGVPISEALSMPFLMKYQLARKVFRERWVTPQGVDPADLAHVVSLYDAQLYYLDQGLGQLFMALKNLGLTENTLIVLASDHGQSFGEHGLYATHEDVYDEITRTVLVMKCPGRRAWKGKVVHELVQSIDVLPTILELLGIPIPSGAAGNSLAPLVERRQPWDDAAISRWTDSVAIRTPKWKLIVNAQGPAELYQLSRDPGETQNLIDRYPQVADELRQRLKDKTVGSHDSQHWIQEHGYW